MGLGNSRKNRTSNVTFCTEESMEEAKNGANDDFEFQQQWKNMES